MTREIEAKIALKSGEIDLLRDRLERIGALPGCCDDEQNDIFDLRIGSGKKRRVRLRRFIGRSDGILTFKRPVSSETFKARDEYEVHVKDADSAEELLHQLGFRPRSSYHKRRESWEVGETLVTLDQLAFGDFVEVEGDPANIEKTLGLLGLGGRPHVRDGYPGLAKRHARPPALLNSLAGS
jgi:adenylate cyclase, class 2